MKKLIFTTVYNDILNNIERLGLDDVDKQALQQSKVVRLKSVIQDKDGGKVEIFISSDENIKRLQEDFAIKKKERLGSFTQEEQQQINENILSKSLLFTAHDIIIYRILLSHYINTQSNGVATITLDTIHSLYRDKDFLRSGYEKYDSQTLSAYIECITKLKRMNLIIQFGSSNLCSFKTYIKDKITFFNQSLIPSITSNLSLEDLKNGKAIEYSLGKFGDYIIHSRQYGQILPPDVFGVRFNQIDIFNIAVYLGKLVFINRLYKKVYKINVYTLLTRFNKYDKNGVSLSKNYLSYLTTLDAVARTKKIKLLNEHINYVLDLLVKDGSVVKYEYNNKFLYKYIKDDELMLTIHLKKRTRRG